MADRRAKKHDVNYNIKRNYIKKKFPLTHTDSERVNEILINVGLEDPKNLNTSQMGTLQLESEEPVAEETEEAVEVEDFCCDPIEEEEPVVVEEVVEVEDFCCGPIEEEEEEEKDQEWEEKEVGKGHFPDFNSDAFKIMHEQLPFLKAGTFENRAKNDEFFRTEYPHMRVGKSHKQGCSECSKRKAGHEMRIMRMECKCKVPGCSLQFKVHKCDFDETHVFYMRGFDVHTHKQMLKGDVAEGASKNAKKRSSVIHKSYKAAVKKVLDEEPEMTAKK